MSASCPHDLACCCAQRYIPRKLLCFTKKLVAQIIAQIIVMFHEETYRNENIYAAVHANVSSFHLLHTAFAPEAAHPLKLSEDVAAEAQLLSKREHTTRA